MTDVSVLRVRGYLACVYAAAAVVGVWVFTTAQWGVPGPLRGILAVAAALLVVSEFLPIRLWSHSSYQEYTLSGAFALVLLQTSPLVYAVLPQILALLIE